MQDKKINVWQKSKLFLKSSLRVLKMDKELIVLPIINMLVALVILAPVIYFAISRGIKTSANSFEFTPMFGLQTWQGTAVWVGIGLLLGVISTLFQAAIIKGALSRFRGEDPTIKGILREVRAKFAPLAAFGLLTTGIGYALQYAEQRLPFGGKVATWLLGAAWSIASLFAVAVIIDEEKVVKPVEATKKSANLVKKAWGENFVSQAGVGLITGLLFFFWLLAVFVFTMSILIRSAVNPGSTASEIHVRLGAGDWVGVGTGVISLIMIIAVSSVLSGIVKAAVYYYATTGESPVEFDKRLLQEAMTPKKAMKVFGK